MYICAITNKVSEPGERMNRVVVETRIREYKDTDGNVIGTGTEIVKEISVSEEGMKILEAQNK